MIPIQLLAERCISSGNCVDLAPEVFEMDEDGLVHVLVDEVEPADLSTIVQAAQVCPVQAIIVGG